MKNWLKENVRVVSIAALILVLFGAGSLFPPPKQPVPLPKKVEEVKKLEVKQPEPVPVQITNSKSTQETESTKKDEGGYGYIVWILSLILSAIFLFLTPLAIFAVVRERRKHEEPEEEKRSSPPPVIPVVVASGSSTPVTLPPPKKSKSKWKWAVGFVVFLVGTVSITYLVADKKYSSGSSSPQARTTGTDRAYAVGMDAILHEICMVESGCQHMKDGKVLIHINKDGSEDVGLYQFHRPTWEKLASDLGLSLEKEEDQKKFAPIAVLKYGYGAWAKSLHKWGPKVHEPISLVIFAKPEDWSEEILMPKTGGKYNVTGFGKKYTLWERGDKGTVEVDLPGGSQPSVGITRGMSFLSREKEDVAITLTIRPSI